MSTSATLPPYTTLHSENPPPYTPGPGTGPEGEEEEERSRAQVEAAGHGEYVPAPALLDQDHPVDPFSISAFPRFADHYILTIVMMVLCGALLNVSAFICLIPALKFSKKSASARQCGEYVEARSKAQWSLWLNVAALISYLVLMMLTIGIVVAILLR